MNEAQHTLKRNFCTEKDVFEHERYTITEKEGLHEKILGAFYEKSEAQLFFTAPELLSACEGILANFHESVATDEALSEFPALYAVSQAINKEKWA